MKRCTLRLSILWCNPIGSLFLSTYTTLHTLFRISPVPCVHCCGFRDCGTPQRSTLLSVVDFFRRLLRLLIIIRPDTPIFLAGEQLACFSGHFVPCFFRGISWQFDSSPSTLLSDAAASAMIPTGQAENIYFKCFYFILLSIDRNM